MIGEKIKQLRRNDHLTQQEFGKLFNLNSSTISLYESNKRMPDYDTLIKIADFFSVSLDWLLGRNENIDLIMNEKNLIPGELLNIGVEYLKLAKELSDSKIPANDIRKIITIITSLKENLYKMLYNII